MSTKQVVMALAGMRKVRTTLPLEKTGGYIVRQQQQAQLLTSALFCEQEGQYAAIWGSHEIYRDFRDLYTSFGGPVAFFPRNEVNTFDVFVQKANWAARRASDFKKVWAHSTITSEANNMLHVSEGRRSRRGKEPVSNPTLPWSAWRCGATAGCRHQ